MSIGTSLRRRLLLLGAVAPWLLVAILGSRGQELDRLPASGRGKFSITEDSMQCMWVSRDAGATVRVAVHCQNPGARVAGGITDIECEYEARPQRCPEYHTKPKLFWSQVGRALKRLRGDVCRDESALVKAPLCRRAHRSAHFKLDAGTSTVSAQSVLLDYDSPPPPPPPSVSASTSTPRTPNATACLAKQLEAEEQCGRTWASLCSFFFSIVDGEDC